MAALREVPFGLYYGSVDSTPLFVMLAGLYVEAHRRRRNTHASCGRRSRPRWPGSTARATATATASSNIIAQTDDGLANQGWKDSHDAIFHADGTLAEGPIALAEVQGYVYCAKRAGGALRRSGSDAHEQAARARCSGRDRLAERFDASFWCEEIGTYALALDGSKQHCRVRSSNAGQVLFSGIARPDRAREVGEAADAAAVLLRLGHSHRCDARRRATIRCPITTARCGRTTMR